MKNGREWCVRHAWVWLGGAVIGLVLSWASPAAAQPASGQATADAVGFKENRDYVSELPFEAIDALNGNLTLTFTDLVLPGNAGRELRFQRTYNGKDEKWQFGPAGVPVTIDDTFGPFPGGAATAQNWVPHLFLADGSDLKTTWMDDLDFTSPATLAASSRWAISSKFWRFDRHERRLYLPDGTVAFYELASETEFRMMLRLTRYEDAFGNAVSFSYEGGGRIERVIQHLGAGQTRDVAFGYGETGTPHWMEFQGQRWTYEYNHLAFRGPMLTSVLPPVGPAWTFAYAENGATSGELTTVTTPQGGTIGFTYDTHQFGRLQNAHDQTQVFSRVVTSRTVGGRAVTSGTWTYRYADNAEDSIIIAPSGVRTRVVHTLIGTSEPNLAGDGWAVTARYIEEPRNGSWATLQEEHITYTGQCIGADPAVCVAIIPLQESRSITRDGVTRTVIDEYGSSHFGDYHRPWKTTETGDLTRVTTRGFTYAFSRTLSGRTELQILGKPSSETVTIGGESFARSWEYDTDGFQTKATVYGVATTFTPTDQGNVKTETNANGHTTTYAYDWAVPSTITPPIASTEIRRTVNSAGWITKQEQGGRATLFGYDARGRLTSRTPPLGSATVTAYDNVAGTWVKATRGNTFVQTTVDGFGRVIRTEDAEEGKTETEYDAEGRITRTSHPYKAVASRRWMLHFYDGLGRLKEKRMPDASSVEYTWTGGTVSIKDENGHRSEQRYSAFGDPDDTWLTSVKDADGGVWTYGYNALGKIRSVAPPDGRASTTRTWTYHANGQVWKETHPESGTTEHGYDNAGNLTSKTDANHSTITYQYDANERLRTMIGPSGTTRYEYEPGSDLRTLAESSVSSRYVYDGAGRMTRRTDIIDGETFLTEYKYDALDRLDELTYPNSRRVEYSYDKASRITFIEDITYNDGRKTYASEFDYHPSGALKAYKAGNGVTTAIEYSDDRLRPRRIKVDTMPGQPDFELAYEYDAVGNITEINDAVRPTFSQTFGYDALDRLTSAVTPNQSPYFYLGQQFTYDDHGRQWVVNSQRGYDDNTLRMTSDLNVPFGYDNAGRLTSRANDAFSYNTTGMMTRVHLHGGRTLDYAYDADDLRALRDEPARGATPRQRSYFIHDAGGQLIAEYAKTGTGSREAVRDYIYAGSRLVAVVKSQASRVSWAAATQSVAEPANGAACTPGTGPTEPYTAEIALRLPGGGQLANRVLVHYAVTGGSYLQGLADPATDYSAPATGTVEFLAGALDGARQPVSIGIRHDCWDEADETFQLTITGVDDASHRVRAAGVTTQTVTILDNDEPPVMNLSSDVTLTESIPGTTPGSRVPNTAVFTALLSAGSGRPVTVRVATPQPPAGVCAFFEPLDQILTFPEGQTSMSFTVTLVDDAKGNEPQRQFQVGLSALQFVTPGARLAASGYVNDDVHEKVDALALPGTYLASARSPGADRLDYVLIANPYGRPVTATITTVFDDGSAWRHATQVPMFGRYTFDLGAPESACEAGASVAVQVQDPNDVLAVEHAGYMGAFGGLSTEAVEKASTWSFAEGHTGFGRELLDVFNPNAFPVNVEIALYGGAGLIAGATRTYALLPLRRGQWPLNSLTPSAGHGLVVRATTTAAGQTATVVATRTVLADPQLVWTGSTDGHSTPGVSTPGPEAYLAEGFVGSGLKTFLAVMSTSDVPTTLTVEYIHQNGVVYTTQALLGGRRRITLEPDGAMPFGGFGYRIKSSAGAPFVAERVMYTLPGWSAGHAGVAVGRPSGVRHFAEGATGRYETHFLVTNPSTTADAVVVLEFFDEAGNQYLREQRDVPRNTRVEIDASTLDGNRDRIFHTRVSGTLPLVTERVAYWPSRAPAALMSAFLFPFAPGTTFLATPRVWTPPTDGASKVFPYTITPATRIGPEWDEGRLASARAASLEQVTMTTSLASGDLWLAGHLSGGREVSADAQVATVRFQVPTTWVTEGGQASVTVIAETATGANLVRPLTVTVSTAAVTDPAAFPATPGVDFTPREVTLTFNANSPSGSAQTVTVQTRQDTRREYSEPFRLVLSQVSGGGVLGGPSSHVVNIMDDDLDPTITISDRSECSPGVACAARGQEGRATFSPTLTLSTASEQHIAVTVTTRAGTALAGLDFGGLSTFVTFAPGETQKAVPIAVVDDDKSEPTETFYVDVTSAVHVTIARATGAMEILDNEPPRVPIDPALSGLYFADVTSAPGVSSYVLLSNPNPVATTARLTFTRPNASGLVRDVPLAAFQRKTFDLVSDPELAGKGDVSLAVQRTHPAYPILAEVSHYWDADWRGGRNTRGTAASSVHLFAEGAANGFFDESFTIHNVTSGPVFVLITLLEGRPTPRQFSYVINEGPGRLKVRVNDLVGDTSHGTVIEASTLTGQPAAVAVERTSYWAGGDRREGHSSNGAYYDGKVWYFAEGAKGAFATYLSLATHQPSASQVALDYFHENGLVYTQTGTIPARGQLTLEPPAGMPGGSFGVSVRTVSDVPFIAERTMYSGANWTSGASETGTPYLGTRWHFAEGASNNFFSSWLLLLNPGTTAATGTLTFRLENGSVVTAPFSVAARSRGTISLASIAGLTGQTFSIDLVVTNAVPIVAERTMYWPSPWSASHTSLGRLW